MKSESDSANGNIAVAENETYYSCNSLQNGGLSFFTDNIIRTCCMGISDEYIIAKTTDNIDEILEKMSRKRLELVENIKNGTMPWFCKCCMMLKKDNWQGPDKGINFINMNNFIVCNLECKYCGNVNQDLPNKVKDTNTEDILNILRGFIERGVMKPGLPMEITGGEPAILKELDQLIGFCIDNKIDTRIHTNCTVYKESIAKAVNTANFYITMTPDAGSREVYREIKGVDCFDKVWGTIGKYMEATNSSKNMHAKFIIQPDNLLDIENMIKMCVEKKVKSTIVDLDYQLSGKNVEFYPQIKKFIKLCKENNIAVKNGMILTKEAFESLL